MRTKLHLEHLEPKPYEGSGHLYCSTCRHHRRPKWQIHIQQWVYKYYCSDDCLPAVNRPQSRSNRSGSRTYRPRPVDPNSLRSRLLVIISKRPHSFDELVTLTHATTTTVADYLTSFVKEGLAIRASSKDIDKVKGSYYATPDHEAEIREIEANLRSTQGSRADRTYYWLLREGPKSVKEIAQFIYSRTEPRYCRMASGAVSPLEKEGRLVSARLGQVSYYAVTEQHQQLNDLIESLKQHPKAG